MDKLKILIINNLYPPQVVGGYERAIADYARHLKERGHTVRVLTANVEGLKTSYTEQDADPEMVRRCFSLWGTWNEQGAQTFHSVWAASIAVKNYQILEQELLSFPADVCLAGNVDFLGAPVIEQILASGIPVAHYVMNSEPGYPPQLAPKTSFYKYITVSDWICQNLKQYGYPTESAQTIYPGAYLEEFYQAELPSRDRLRIVYAGLVMPYKGTDILIEALSVLHAAGVDFTATIAGGSLMPEFVNEVQEFVASEGLSDVIQFPGLLSRQELKKLYQTHNVWVLPSRFQEPFSIGLLEAMAAGLTIIASNTGGSPEAIEHEKSGLIFESENILELADLISFLPLNPDEWEAMTRQGQARALSNFSRTQTMDQLETVLFDLAHLHDS